jgi:hypothetical protein
MHLLTTRRMAWLGALLFTILFYQQRPGLNLIIFESVFLWWLFRSTNRTPLSLTSKWVLICHVLTMFGVVLSNSIMALMINVVLTAMLPAVFLHPKARSLASLAAIGVYSGFHAPIRFMKEKSSKFSLFYWMWKLRFLMIPIFIVLFFLIIYTNANAVFGDVVEKSLDKFFNGLNYIFEEVDSTIFMVAIFGLFVSIVLLFRSLNQKWADRDQEAQEVLLRKRSKRKNWFGSINGLKTEYKAAVFLLVTLNLMIALLNSIDISQIWFGFAWRGENFAEMVHEGTALLILSILISIGIVLFYFRKNLHFYPGNVWLKRLSYLWIAQNGILLVSVFLRNYHYCKVFSLAEKRIGVFIFLIIVVFGLWTVYRKVKHNLTAYYLFRMNSLCILMVLTMSSLVPWDIVIAQFNFSRSGKAFVYLEHMESLSDKALPYIDKNIAELEHITQSQYDQFSFREKFMSTEEYVVRINTRKLEFIQRWEESGVFSWNLAEYLAYRELKSKGL